MRRPFALLAGFVTGILLSGILVAVLMATLPDAWRNERLVWGSSLALIGASVLGAFVMSRGAPD
jgi:cytochrome c biogenesis protein CcdA